MNALAYFDYPPVFDPQRSPVYWYRPRPTRPARVGKDMNDATAEEWMRRHNEILAAWPVEKGIVHCVSYPRSKDIYRLTDDRRRLLWHSSWNTAAKLDEFRSAPADSGAVLLSPAVTTGYDFPDDACRFQIIAKIPHKDTRSRIMQARCKADPDYALWLTAQDVMQTAGRAMRHEKDWCVTYIIDDHWEWWYWKAKKKGMLANWFVKLVEAGGEVRDARKLRVAA